MSLLSRRQFLQLAGITLLDSSLPLGPLWPPSPVQTATALHGRTLMPTTVFSRPDQHSPMLSTLWPDSIVTLYDHIRGWYQVGSGFVPQTAVQPLLLHPVEPVAASAPFFGEVTSPVAPVRQWAAADAPLVTRIGHSGVASVIDYLPVDNGSGWYALANADQTVLGWTQAVHWQPISLNPVSRQPNLRIEIQQAQQQLTVFQGQQSLLRVPLSINTPLPTGTFDLKREDPHFSPFALSGTNTIIYGAPWPLQIDQRYTMVGVYWHNDFGQAAPGSQIQLTALAARWLYQQVSDNASVTIV